MITIIVALERSIGTLSLATVPVEIDDALSEETGYGSIVYRSDFTRLDHRGQLLETAKLPTPAPERVLSEPSDLRRDPGQAREAS
jgi:hypothetical protein